MFSSSGFFANIDCPFSKRGSCERPHCLYRHAVETPHVLDASCDSLLTDSSGGVPNGAGANRPTQEVCLRELKRLTKEIETVRNEVEQERRRLSYYRIGSKNASTSEKGRKISDKNCHGSPLSTGTTKMYSQRGKYVVDGSKPRTDLEYDPLSNFSAGLHSGAQPKAKNDQIFKKARYMEPDRTKPTTCKPSVPPRSLSSEPKDELIEDSVLIIDIPSSPDANEEKKPKLLDSGANKSLKSAEVACTLPLLEKPTSDKVLSLATNEYAKEGKGQTIGFENQKLEIKEMAESAAISIPPQPVEKAEPGPSCLPANKHSALGGTQLSESRCDEMIYTTTSSDSDSECDEEILEECFRIWMEENNKDKGNELPQAPAAALTVDAERSQVKVESQDEAVKKRVAHKQVAEPQPQPQGLVPLQTCAASGVTAQPGYRLVTSKMQQVQQRVCSRAASANSAQMVVSTANQKRPDTQGAAPCVQMSKNLQPAPVQNAYVNCLPAGTAVINVGNNLHFIVSKDSVPIGSSAVTTILTPIGHVQASVGGLVKENCLFPVVSAAQRGHTAATVLIPIPARRPAPTVPAYSVSAAPTSVPAGHTSVQSARVKRKIKRHSKAPTEKVPHNVRQRYVNMFTEEFLKTANVNEAFQKALAEERTVYNRSVNEMKYLSVAVNALKKLKNQNAAAAKGGDKCNNQKLRGSIPLNLKKLNGTGDEALYESFKAYILPEEKLIESNYPVQHPEKLGCAMLYADNTRRSTDVHKRICCRCGATYSVSQTGKHTRKEECNYHYGKGVTNKVPGGVETRYSCCEGVMGAPGCQVFKLHVHDSLSLDGFVQTAAGQSSATSCPGVYSLDCEMCYTIQGLELSRVTLVNSSLQVIYDTFVRPDNEVIDYNTRFSGISEEDVKGHHTSLSEVQETLLSFISADTILIGHSLEMDLCALKLLHGTVVDTSVVFPHHLGPPHKLTLSNLTAEYLRRIIQESECGHDTAEDATACMELMLWKIKEDGKMRTGGNKT